MKIRWWLNIALVIVIVVLTALIYFKPGTHKPAPPVALTTLNASDITSIKIARGHDPVTQLVRDGANWQMLSPVKTPAAQYLVKALLDAIHAQVKSSFPAKQADLVKYGLNPPQVRLWLNGTEFDFGDAEPLNNYRYVKTGDAIHLIAGLLYFRINHGPLWWASKRLLPDGARVIGLQLPDATLTLKDDKWQLAPANPAIPSDAIQSLVDNWKNAQAIGTDKIGNGEPQGEVAVELAGDNQPLRFVILEDPDFLVLARPDLGLQYDLDSGQRPALLELKPVKASATPSTKSGKLRDHRKSPNPTH
ncbi:MAG: DUF4340 domain-containing protein [Gammaproteobacteria bacterium]